MFGDYVVIDEKGFYDSYTNTQFTITDADDTTITLNDGTVITFDTNKNFNYTDVLYFPK